MQLTRLDRDGVIHLYETRLAKDFPRSERKPLAVLLRAMRDGRYEPLALTEDDETLGYAFLMKTENDCMLDYLATDPARRNCGLGSKLLGMLLAELNGVRSFILEAEDPEFASDDASRELQTRRIGFYERNGFVVTGVTAVTYGVHYKILVREGDTLPEDELRRVYRAHYRAYMPEVLCKRYIKI